MGKTLQLKANQHFVPQSYLRNWCEEGGELWALDKFGFKQRKRGTRKVASADFAYDTKLTLDFDNPETLQFFENEFSRLESIAKLTFDDVIRKARQTRSLLLLPNSKYSILESEFDDLSFFAGLQILRDEQFRDKLRDNLNAFYKRLWDETAPILFGSDERSVSFDFVDEDYVKNYQMAFLTTRQDLFKRALSQKIIVIGYNATGTGFLTSDSPVWNSGYVLDWSIPWDGLNSPSSIVVYPLAPDVAVIFLDRTFYVNQRSFDRTIVTLNLSDVEKFNKHQALQSHKHIFSNTNDFAAAKSALAKRSIPGKDWPIPPKRPETRFESLITMLKQHLSNLPKGTYTEQQWLSLIQQKGCNPFDSTF